MPARSKNQPLIAVRAGRRSLVEPPLWSGLSELWRRRKDKTAEELALLLDAAEGAGAAVLDSAEVAEMTGAASAVAGLEELPEDWLAQLAAEGIVAQTFVEASAHVLRLGA